MPFFVKKPVVIEARQWDGTAEGATPIIDWIFSNGHTAQFQSDYASIAIYTLEGTITASPGDFVIRGVQGEFYPCKPDIFADTYEPQEKHEMPFNTNYEVEKLTGYPRIFVEALGFQGDEEPSGFFLRPEKSAYDKNEDLIDSEMWYAAEACVQKNGKSGRKWLDPYSDSSELLKRRSLPQRILSQVYQAWRRA